MGAEDGRQKTEDGGQRPDGKFSETALGGQFPSRECFQTLQILLSCHSERSEESMRSLAIWPSLPWILRFAQDDKPGLKTLPNPWRRGHPGRRAGRRRGN